MKEIITTSTICNPMDYTVHGILQAKILEVGSLSFLQGTFPTQRSNPGLLYFRWILYHLSHKGIDKYQSNSKNYKQLYTNKC